MILRAAQLVVLAGFLWGMASFQHFLAMYIGGFGAQQPTFFEYLFMDAVAAIVLAVSLWGPVLAALAWSAFILAIRIHWGGGYINESCVETPECSQVMQNLTVWTTVILICSVWVLLHSGLQKLIVRSSGRWKP